MDERVENMDLSRIRAFRNRVSDEAVLSLRPQQIIIVFTWSGIVHLLSKFATSVSLAPL